MTSLPCLPHEKREEASCPLAEERGEGFSLVLLSFCYPGPARLHRRFRQSDQKIWGRHCHRPQLSDQTPDRFKKTSSTRLTSFFGQTSDRCGTLWPIVAFSLLISTERFFDIFLCLVAVFCFVYLLLIAITAEQQQQPLHYWLVHWWCSVASFAVISGYILCDLMWCANFATREHSSEWLDCLIDLQILSVCVIVYTERER